MSRLSGFSESPSMEKVPPGSDCFAAPIVPPGAQNYPVCTKNVKFSVLRHFAKRGFGTGNASFSPLPGPGNSPAGFPCKTRDVGQLVLGAAAAAAALFAEKRAGANVKNS